MENKIFTEEEINLTIKLEEEALEREAFLKYLLNKSDKDFDPITAIDWIDENYDSLKHNEDEVIRIDFEKYLERKSRTGKESATLVEKVISHILSEKRKKRATIKGNGKIPKDWFNDLIRRTCCDNNISEGHIRLVGAWNLNDEVSDVDPID